MDKTTRILILFLLSLPLTACRITPSTVEKQSLYEQLGGQQGLNNIVNRFTLKLARDEQIFPYFAKASVSHFKKGFVSHLCHVANGPCEYKGDNMVDIHTGMHISEADFNKVVELLVEAMEEADISYPIQNKVLAKLAPMRKDVIKI